MSNIKTLFLDGNEVEKNLPIKDLLNGIEKGFVQLSNKEDGVINPQRMVINIQNNDLFFIKPAVSTIIKTLGAKILTLYPENETKYHIPSHQAVITIFNSDTGSLDAVMDGVSVTDLRTAAATGVAFKYLSPQTPDNILTIIGTGHQAASHLKVFRSMSNFKEIRVCSRSSFERAKKFAAEWNVVPYDTVEQGAKDADIIITVAKSTSEPLISNQWVKKGALVCIVGAPMPTQRDVDDNLMQNSFVIADSVSSSYESSGDVIQSKIKLSGELGDIITNKLQVDWERTRVFKSNGLAIQDIIAGRIVVDNVRKSNAK